MDLKTVCLPSSYSIHIDESSSQTSGSLLVQLMAVSVETDNGSKFREVSVALSSTWGIYITPYPMPVRDRLWSRRGKTARARDWRGPQRNNVFQTGWDNCTHEVRAVVVAVQDPHKSEQPTLHHEWSPALAEKLPTAGGCCGGKGSTSIQTWAALLAHKKGRKRREKDKSFWVTGSSSDQAVKAWASWGTVE